MDLELLSKIKSVITEEEVIEIIKNLVEIPSYPGVENQESKVAKYIYTTLSKEGIESKIVPVIDGRCNVIAKLRGNNSSNSKSLLLTGHTDTVPPYDMPNPFQLRTQGNRMYGRGVVDMKGALACMMGAMIAIKRAKINLDGDLIFAGVIDEEEGSEGTIALLENGLKVDAAIVGEPCNLNICVAHRGLEWLEFHFKGKTVHGGKQSEGINAILKASNFIQALEKDLIPKIQSKTHPIIGTSSMNYGTINGGTQPSTVAGSATLTIDRRWIPGEKYADVMGGYQNIIDSMAKEDPEFNCELRVMDVSLMKEGYVHESMETDIDHPIVQITKKATEEIYKQEPQITFFPAWSDGGLLSSYGNIPTIVFGPGDLESAHSAEEFLDKTQVFPTTLIYASIALKFCNND